jgi:hypothetical protein
MLVETPIILEWGISSMLAFNSCRDRRPWRLGVHFFSGFVASFVSLDELLLLLFDPAEFALLLLRVEERSSLIFLFIAAYALGWSCSLCELWTPTTSDHGSRARLLLKYCREANVSFSEGGCSSAIEELCCLGGLNLSDGMVRDANYDPSEQPFAELQRAVPTSGLSDSWTSSNFRSQPPPSQAVYLREFVGKFSILDCQSAKTTN